MDDSHPFDESLKICVCYLVPFFSSYPTSADYIYTTEVMLHWQIIGGTLTKTRFEN